MDESIYLVKPTVSMKEAYVSFYEEWKQSGEEMIPSVIQKDPSAFEKMVQALHDAEAGRNLAAGRVPASTYWLVTASAKVVGAVNIRHRLTPYLYHRGGHIGYGIRPTERGKGYAKRLLALSLEQAKLWGIKRVLVTCDEQNIPSRRTILANGGIPDRNFIEENGNVVQRFWVDLNHYSSLI
ncbi:GNAT family N-acetyltransferase [Hazenella sp. IB182357]|uniref:GNAT family N-acetyltransferase n=1 Tax=Polycladospora coralii TaxID=2771432 RepID=A0A926RU15_9BACL|nr:GNAT family N-acetyltransferase [Polycladospora coralii]MBD1371834.1 GNAT family N-acetyltransferase [Polycladospora coralii]